MFGKAARQLTRLKGKRYEGAVIAEAIWQHAPMKAEANEQKETLPEILRDKHCLLQLRAHDGADMLIVTMLLGRKAPQAKKDKSRKQELTAYVQGEALSQAAKSFSFVFSAQQVHEFCTAVQDTNILHQGDKPLVPGLLLLQNVVKQLPKARRIRMRFSVPVFANETVTIKICQEVTQNSGKS